MSPTFKTKLVALLTTIIVAGCGSSTPTGDGRPIGGAYLSTTQDGATVETLNLVRHGSRLTGNAEALAAVTSEQASCGADVLDAYGRPVSGCPDNHAVVDPQTDEETAPTDNAACGGTPLCFEDLIGSVDGQLGDNGRISIRVVWNDGTGVATPAITSVGTLRGDGFVLDGLAFIPSDSEAIATARSKAPAFLRTVAIPAYAIHLEIAALQKPTIGQTDTPWDELLAQDVSTLRSDVDEANDPNQLGCGYSDVVTSDIASMQSDVTALATEITKAHKLVSSVTPAVARDAGDDIATVQGEITARRADLRHKQKQANAIIGQATADRPKVESALQQIECGAIHLAFHVILEGGD
jgi:hypothetical protein